MGFRHHVTRYEKLASGEVEVEIYLRDGEDREIRGSQPFVVRVPAGATPQVMGQRILEAVRQAKLGLLSPGGMEAARILEEWLDGKQAEP